MNKKYPSKYSNNKFVSAAQYITEIICEKKAIKDKEDLHYRFWINKKWSSFYRNQIATANDLVKKYDDQAIISALNSKECQNIYSLRAPFLKASLDKHQKILEEKNKSLKNVEFERKDNIKFRENKTNKSNILSRLKDIDNGI